MTYNSRCVVFVLLAAVAAVSAGGCGSSNSASTNISHDSIPIVQTAKAGPTPTQYVHDSNYLLVHHVTGTNFFVDAIETNSPTWKERAKNDLVDIESAYGLWLKLSPPADQMDAYGKVKDILAQISPLCQKMMTSIDSNDMVTFNAQQDELDSLIQQLQPYIDLAVLAGQ